MRIYTYVDGESHYTRTLAVYRDAFGQDAALSSAVYRPNSTGSSAYPAPVPPYLRVLEPAKFFWDISYPFAAPGALCGKYIQSAAYFTAISGDDDAYHQACVTLRTNGFHPRVARERSQLAGRRENRLQDFGILEKAKGVDIGLSVAVLEDAYHNNFDACYLFTSDIDFLPVIRVVQRMGKKAIVFGYRNGLGARSELEYVPDAFVDLTDHVRTGYAPTSPPAA